MAGRIKKKHARNSLEGRALETLEEIRITGVPSWQAEKIEVFISFSPETTDVANDMMSDEEWNKCIELWLRLVEPQGVFKSVDGAMNPLDKMTARQYINSQPLDLDYLSWPSSDTM